MWESKLTEVVPMTQISVSESTLRAVANEVWIQNEREAVRRTQLSTLATMLRDKDIFSAVLADEIGRNDRLICV